MAQFQDMTTKDRIQVLADAGVPSSFHRSLEAYVCRRVRPPQGILDQILCGDVYAILDWDPKKLNQLYGLVSLIWAYFPKESYGSAEKVKAWSSPHISMKILPCARCGIGLCIHVCDAGSLVECSSCGAAYYVKVLAYDIELISEEGRK